MASGDHDHGAPTSIEALIRPLLRDGLNTVTINNDLLVLDVNANEVDQGSLR
jgi:hypothetical protein